MLSKFKFSNTLDWKTVPLVSYAKMYSVSLCIKQSRLFSCSNVCIKCVVVFVMFLMIAQLYP